MTETGSTNLGFKSLRFTNPIRVIGVCCGSLVVLNGIFFLLLTLVLLIPSGTVIEAHLRDAFGSHSMPLSGYDSYSECLGLGVNLMDTDKSIFYRVVAAPVVQFATEDARRFRMVHSGSTVVRYHSAACPALISHVKGTEATMGMPLFRFWHGYQVYTRTLLSIMSVSNMHKMTAVLLFGSFVFLGFRLAVIFGAWTWAVLVVPFVLVGDLLSMPLSTTHALQVAWFFLSTALVATILKHTRERHLAWLPVFAFSAGAISNFLSFLYNPSLGAGLMGLMVIAARLSTDATERNRQALGDGTLTIGAWFAGYGMTWISKWTLAVAVSGFQTILPDLKVASSGSAYGLAAHAGHLSFLHTSWKVSHHGVDHLQFMLVAFASITLAILLKYAIFGHLNRDAMRGFCVMQVPAFLQIAWVEIMRAHSLEHWWVFRNFLLLGICPLLGAILVARQSRPLLRAEALTDEIVTPHR